MARNVSPCHASEAISGRGDTEIGVTLAADRYDARFDDNGCHVHGMALACLTASGREGTISMRRIKLRLSALTVAALALAPGAIAAPYCVQTEAIPPQCLYFDAASCDARAKQIGGYCSVNSAELRIAPGIGHFCLLTSGNVSTCYWPDADSCNSEARRQHGVCVAAPARDESPPPDPYAHIRPLTVGGGARN
jgi:hypothetical protein